MCDLKAKILFTQLSSPIDKIRNSSVNEIYNIYQNTESARENIVNELIKGLGTVTIKSNTGFSNAINKILLIAEINTFDLIINKMKEHLYLTETKLETNSELVANKLGSLLAFDILVTSNRMKDVNKETLTIFLKFVLELVNDKIFGYLSTEILFNYLKTISKKDFEKIKTMLKKELFQMDQFENSPQLLILWLAFSTEQKKMLKSVNKVVPSINADGDICSKLPLLMKGCKPDHMLLIFNHIAASSAFSILWPSIKNFYLKNNSDLKEKQAILLMGFEIIIPNKTSAIAKLAAEKRKSIIDLIWKNDLFLNLVLKQLSDSELDLHQMCSQFVTSLNKIDDKTEQPFLEHMFKNLITLKFMETELKTTLNNRISNNLIKFVDDADLCKEYINNLKSYEKSGNDNKKIYFFEQLTTLSNKFPQEVIELLLIINMQYNHSESNESERVINAAKAAFLRCVESIPLTELEKLKSLLIQADTFAPTNMPIKSLLKSVLLYWETPTSKPKKRSASEIDKITVDTKNIIDSMFIGMQAHLCLYMACQMFDQETMDVVDDLRSCFKEMKGDTEDISVVNKKAKVDTSIKENSEKTWKLVFTDILTLFMEQNCHYLRSLSTKAFKILVSTGHCDETVVALIKSTILDIEVEINGVDKKKNVTSNVEEDKNEGEGDDDVESDDSDESGDESESEDEKGDNELENVIKERISAALSSMNVDVDSDADDNCPDDDNAMSSDEDSKVDAVNKNSKGNLKTKRFNILQLRQYRNRCIDLLDIVILNGSKLDIRMCGFFAFLELLRKGDSEIQSHLMKTISTFKSKYTSKEVISSENIVNHLNNLIKSVEKCKQTKTLVTVFSDVMITLLRINKSDISMIIHEFEPIIENCITNKKNNSIKAVFLAMFNSFPEIGWAFHKQVLKYTADGQPKLVQYRAFEILRKILQNPAMKALKTKKDDSDNEGRMLMSKEDIFVFVKELIDQLNTVIVTTDFENNPKHSSIVLGTFIDCLKLCPENDISLEVMSKVKSATAIVSLPKELKKIISQFVSAVNLAKSVKKN